MTADNKSYDLGEKVRKFRLSSNKSQFEIEMAIGASPGSISRIENGQVNPTKETLDKIANALNLSPSQIAELYDVRVFNAESILEKLIWLTDTLDLDELLQKSVDILFQIHKNYIGGVIYWLSEDKNSLVSLKISNLPSIGLFHNILGGHVSLNKISINENPENLIVQTFNTLEIRESTDAFDFAKGAVNKLVTYAAAKVVKLDVAITYPLFDKDKVYGVILFGKTKEKSFSEYEKNLLDLLSKQVSVCITNALKYQELSKIK